MRSESKIGEECGRTHRSSAAAAGVAGAALVSALFALGGSSTVFADVAYRDTLDKAVTFATPETAEEVNSFDVFAGAAETFDTNLFRLPTSADIATLIGPNASWQDHIATASLGLDGQWYVGRQQINLNLRADDNRFAQNTDLNNVSGAGSLTWNWEVGPALSGEVGADYNRSLAGFYNTNVYSKDMVDHGEYFGSLRYQVGPHVQLSGGLLYQDTTLSAAGAQANDNHRTIADVGAEYGLSVTTSVGVNYRYTNTHFSQYSPLNGNYTEDSPRLLLKYAPTDKTRIDVIAGYLKRTYASEAIGNFSGDVWRFAMQWNPTNKTQLVATAWRNLQAYFTAETDYFVSNAVSLTPSWTATEKLTFSLMLYRETQDYIGSSTFTVTTVGRRDTINAAEAGVVYTPLVLSMSRSLTFNASFRHENRDSNQAGLSYIDNLAKVGFIFKF